MICPSWLPTSRASQIRAIKNRRQRYSRFLSFRPLSFQPDENKGEGKEGKNIRQGCPLYRGMTNNEVTGITRHQLAVKTSSQWRAALSIDC